jgi:hypothetical protein
MVNFFDVAKHAQLLLPPHMAFNCSNTTKILSAALQRVARLEPSLTREEKETPAQTVAKGVTVSLSNDAKMHIMKDMLK